MKKFKIKDVEKYESEDFIIVKSEIERSESNKKNHDYRRINKNF